MNTFGYVGGNPIEFYDLIGLKRPLTTNESAFLAKYYGNNLNVSNIMINGRDGSRASSIAGTITFPNNYFVDNSSENELRLENPAVCGVFAHEALHNQQAQEGESPFFEAMIPQALYALDLLDPYAYDQTIQDPKSLLDLYKDSSVEQRGQIVQDYVKAYESGGSTSKYSQVGEYIRGNK